MIRIMPKYFFVGLLVFFIACNVHAQDAPPAGRLRTITLADSLSAYAGMIVTDLQFEKGRVSLIEYFNCGNYLVIKGSSVDSLFKVFRKREKSKDNIDTLLKQAYEREVLSLEQKHCFTRNFSAYLGKEVRGYTFHNKLLYSINVYEGGGLVEIKNAALQDLLKASEERNGYDIIPYVLKCNRDEDRLLNEWRSFD